jgi:signal transduction histidine kinase
MDASVTQIPAAVSDRGPLVAVAEASLGRRIAEALERSSPPFARASLRELRLLASRSAPPIIALDGDLLGDAPLAAELAPLIAAAPLVLFAPPERQPEIARLLVSGDVEFVARAGDFVPAVVALIERRARWAAQSASLLGPPWAEFPDDLGAVFRHEINNPLTGILGNAELLLAHRERLAPADAQRLQIVVDLAVRLRETIRRVSNAFEQRPASAKSA